MSTDYVFDGNNPPYRELDEPKPLNKYGESKLCGEKTVLDVNKSINQKNAYALKTPHVTVFIKVI